MTTSSSSPVAAVRQAYHWPQGPGAFLIRPLKVFLPLLEQRIQKLGHASYWRQIALRIAMFIVRYFFWMMWSCPTAVGVMLNLRALSQQHPEPLRRAPQPLTSAVRVLLSADKKHKKVRKVALRCYQRALVPCFYQKWVRLESIISEIGEQIQRPGLRPARHLIGKLFFHIKDDGSVGQTFSSPKMRYVKTVFVNIYNFKEFALERMKEIVQKCGSRKFIMQEFAIEVSLGKDNKVTVEIHSVIPAALYDKLQKSFAKSIHKKMLGIL